MYGIDTIVAHVCVHLRSFKYVKGHLLLLVFRKTCCNRCRGPRFGMLKPCSYFDLGLGLLIPANFPTEAPPSHNWPAVDDLQGPKSATTCLNPTGEASLERKKTRFEYLPYV